MRSDNVLCMSVHLARLNPLKLTLISLQVGWLPKRAASEKAKDNAEQKQVTHLYYSWLCVCVSLYTSMKCWCGFILAFSV